MIINHAFYAITGKVSCVKPLFRFFQLESKH